MYFQYTRAQGENYKQFLLEKKFTPQNIYTKTQVQLSSIQDFEEIIGDEEFYQECSIQSRELWKKLYSEEVFLEHMNKVFGSLL